MNDLTLIRVGRNHSVFLQYLPQNLHKLLSDPHAVCIGAVFRNTACGVALAERTGPDECYVRYIYVDPAVRFCGLGTYLLRGLLGQLQLTGVSTVKAVYSNSMLEPGMQTLHIFTRAGFSPPRPISTSFSTCLNELTMPEIRIPDNVELYTANQLSDILWATYEILLEIGQFSSIVDIRMLNDPCLQTSVFCCVDGRLIGVLLVDKRDDALHVAGVHVQREFRWTRVAALMIQKAIQEAKTFYTPQTEVTVSTINKDAYALCEKLFPPASMEKETEYLATYQF